MLGLSATARLRGWRPGGGSLTARSPAVVRQLLLAGVVAGLTLWIGSLVGAWRLILAASD
jgi:hypothetical protein